MPSHRPNRSYACLGPLLVAHRRLGPLGLVVALWLGLLGSPAARANPVNAENLIAEPERDGWRGSLETRLAMSRGNVDRLDFSTTGSLGYWTLYPEGAGHRRAVEGAPRFFRDRWVLLTNGAFVRVGDSDVVNRGFGHTRYTRMWIPRLGSDLFAQAQFNELNRLRVRLLAGLGLRVDPVRRKHVQVWAGTGYMAEYELNDTVPGDPHPAEVVNHRWTNYVVGQLLLFDAALVARNTVYAQPRWDDFGDIRVLDALQVEARVGKFLALGVDFQAQYDSRPPQEVVPLDLLLGSYVRLGFG